MGTQPMAAALAKGSQAATEAMLWGGMLLSVKLLAHCCTLVYFFKFDELDLKSTNYSLVYV